jgi:phenylacetate-CoA ligase
VFHVNTDACIVETVDDGGRPVAPSEEGRILLTNLYNCTMPFIRYDIRDRGTLLPLGVQGSCACGSRRPRMKLLGGREDDYVFLPSGRRVSPRLVGTAVYRAAMDPMPQGGVRWLFRGFQVVQDALDHMTVRVIPEPDRSVDLEERLTRALLELHPAFRCTVMLVDDLPHEPSGKLKKVICSIEPGRRS